MNFKSENGYTLHARSMRKMHKILAISNDKAERDNLFNAHDMVTVAVIPGLPEEFCLLADTYGGNNSLVIEDQYSDSLPLTFMYLNTPSGMYQVAAIHTSEKDSQKFQDQRLDTTWMDTLTLKSGQKLYLTTGLEAGKVLAGSVE